MRIAVLGASGFIGRHLTSALRSRGDVVVAASLRDPSAAAAACFGADAVVNVAGEPVAQRWTAAVKERIRSSRVDAPRAFLQALRSQPAPPRLYVSASAIGYYGMSDEGTFVETRAPGEDFLARVCVAWEAEASRAAELGMRVAIVRTGIALAKDGGALAALLPVFKMGLGGPVASGKQWISWIHIDDLIAIYLLVIEHGTGTYNATAPNPVRNAQFTQALAQALHRPALFRVPTIALRGMLGEAADTLAGGQRVLPQRLLAEGYRFRFPRIEEAFAELFKA